jgi:hypothetical protein
MGFGEKTDFQSNPQRVLNLNRTYENIIKPAVEERRQQIVVHRLVDDGRMDDLVRANAGVASLYELGVHHALRPQRTIVLAENNFSFPFDLNQIEYIGEMQSVGREYAAKFVDMTPFQRFLKKD